MSGKGKDAKRRRTVYHSTIHGVTKPAIRRLARRGGVKRISALLYEEVRNALKLSFLEPILRDAVHYQEHARRKTVTGVAVVHSLRRNNKTLYGFGEVDGLSAAANVRPRRLKKQQQEEEKMEEKTEEKEEQKEA
jgi:histone H4